MNTKSSKGIKGIKNSVLFNYYCFAEGAFQAAQTISSSSFCFLHSPFFLCCQGAQRQLGEVLGIFFFNLYPETQRTRIRNPELPGSREDRDSFSEVGKKCFNTVNFRGALQQNDRNY